MYLRDVHTETDLRILRSVIRENPLGQFTTAISSPSFPLLQSSHIPFVLDIEDESSETELGRLRCHIARANPQSKAIIEELSSPGWSTKVLQQEVLIMFNSPIQHYVTPKFYKETKPTTGKVVPTWNYAAVQVYGKATCYVDTKSDETSAFLDKQLHDLSTFNETITMGYTGKGSKPGPWQVSDSPKQYVDLLKKAIIGIDIEIGRMEGKFKMSQEMGVGDGDGVVEGFRALGSQNGTQMADLVELRRELKRQK